jgi:hypothetical protein
MEQLGIAVSTLLSVSPPTAAAPPAIAKTLAHAPCPPPSWIAAGSRESARARERERERERAKERGGMREEG